MLEDESTPKGYSAMHMVLAEAPSWPAEFSPAALSRLSDPFAAEIVTIVAREFEVPVKEVLFTRYSRCRKPRLAAMYYTRLLSSCSLTELGRLFGGASHTTVMRSFDRCRQTMDRDPAWAERMDRLLVVLVEKFIARA